MIFEHYIILLLAILPILYKYSFWLYLIQLKEYRWDRIKEYLSTPQWKSAIINIWTVVELPLLFLSLIIYFNPAFEIIVINVMFLFLIMQNIFIFRKLLTWHFIKPKLTSRLLLIISLLFTWFIIDISFIVILNLWSYIYSYILLLYLIAPLIILLIIFILWPLVNKIKLKKINKAIKKSKRINNIIKIWITGSYWKSSVKEYLSSILEQHWNTLKTPDNINTELWISDLILNKLKNSYDYFVAEMWAYKIWEIELLWKIVNHKYWFLTAIGNQHIALFWSQDNIKIWKSEIAKSILKNNWVLYVNWNDQYIRETKFDKKLKIVKYWKFNWSNAIYNIVEIKKWVTKFEFIYKKNSFLFETKLLWEHNILNLTWIIAFCYDQWLKTLEIKEYLKNIKTPKNTLNIIKHKKHILIDDSYNLSEDWLYAWLDAMNSFKWKKILIMDDILELWEWSNSIHYAIWEFIARWKKINKVLFCWINYKQIFIKWLIDWWFNKKNIINNIKDINEKSIILFEWRWTQKYLNKLK